MPNVSLDELQGAVDWVSSDVLDNEAYVCRQSGRVFWFSGDGGMADEEDIIPDDIHDVGKYVLVPDKQYLDLGITLALDFAAQYLAEQYDDVRNIFRRKGAYRRFKELLHRRELLEKWYAYGEEHTIKALEYWCESEGLSIER